MNFYGLKKVNKHKIKIVHSSKSMGSVVVKIAFLIKYHLFRSLSHGK